jgi:hypothetical protein
MRPRRALGALAWVRRRREAEEAEREARAILGMPARHPERITRDLSRAEQAWLRAAAAGLWPDGEYEYFDDCELDEGDP